MLALSACSDYDNGYTEQQLNFIRDFKQIYGDIDPTQDWNLAERANVTVTTTSPSDIKIYARYDGRYTLVANYTNVSGTQTLGFDIIEGTNDVLVSDGKMAYKAKVGESVEFGKGTRTIGENKNDIKISLIGESGEDFEVDGTPTHFPQYKEVTKADYKVFLDELPEIGGISADYRKRTNYNRVENDFRYTSTGKFILYPYYFVTGEKDEIGIYYYKEKYDENKNKNTYLEFVKIYTMAGELEYFSSEEGEWYNVRGNSDEMFDDNGDPKKATKVRSQGIVIDIPEGTVFGMYLKQYGRIGTPPSGRPEGNTDYYNDGETYEGNPRYTLYSEKRLNDNKDEDGNQTDNHGYGIKEGDNGVEEIVGEKPCYAATFEANGQMYLAFEDWSNRKKYDNGSDFDFNDVVFAFDGATPIIIPDDEVQSWIISAEDLGNTYDIDYNDVVLEVQYISGQTQANVIPLAAGGTLPSNIYFGKNSLGEIHELLGGTQQDDGLYHPINVWESTPQNKYTRKTEDTSSETIYTDDGILITVPENFSLASSLVGKDYHSASAPNMGGFRIEVTYTGGTTSQSQKIQTIQNSDTEGPDNVPYVICTPKTYKDSNKIERHYRWPQESRPMFPTGTFTDAAYNNAPDGQKFIDWVRNKRTATEWYKYPNEEVTCAP